MRLTDGPLGPGPLGGPFGPAQKSEFRLHRKSEVQAWDLGLEIDTLGLACKGEDRRCKKSTRDAARIGIHGKAVRHDSCFVLLFVFRSRQENTFRGSAHVV